MSYFHVVETTEGLVRSGLFGTYESAKADAVETYQTGQSMDIRGDVVPNFTDVQVDAVEAEGTEYQSGLFWLNNRYGAIFSTRPVPVRG